MNAPFIKLGLASFFLASWPVRALAQQGYGQPGYGGRMMNWGYGWFGGWPMIILWIAIIVGIVFLIKWIMDSNRGQNQARTGEDPLEILKIRYAKGELTKEEYEAMKADLKG